MARQRKNDVHFSWHQFWESLLYENLPPVFVAPIAVLLVERSFKRTVNICRNRSLFAISTKSVSRDFLIRLWLMIYPGSWLVTIGLFIALFADLSVHTNIDPIQMILAYSMLVTRRLIIAVKYGFYLAKDYEALAHDAPVWTSDKTQRRLIFQGWARPREYPGLIEGELDNAMEQIGLDITDMEVATGPKKKTKLIAIVRSILGDVYAAKARGIVPIISVATFLLLFAVIASRLNTGVPVFGVTTPEIIVSLATYAGIMVATNIFGFGLMCGFDFARRQRLADIFQDAFLPPGINVKIDGDKDTNVYFDKHSPNCVNGWVQGRSVARAFGYRYYSRVQAYTSILISYGILCVGTLNIVTWTQIPHHQSTVIMVAIMVGVIATTCSFAMYQAVELQRASYLQRESIQNEMLSLEVEIAMLRRAGDNPEELESQLNAKALLQQVDENLNFEELVFRPTSVLGNKADGTLIGSVLGIIVTGGLLALQGFASTAMSYDMTGWFR